MSESSEKAGTQHTTDRPLNQEYAPWKGMEDTVLDHVGLSIEDLRDKKTLDVGIGGGLALSEARKLGLDYYGVDLLPVKEQEYELESYDAYKEFDEPTRREEMKRKLLRRAESNPSRVIVADAQIALPFSEDSFDVVLANKSALLYARTAEQVKRAIIEMIRVSKGIVATSESFNNDGKFVNLYSRNPYGPELMAEFGKKDESFNLNLKEFLDTLRECGISYQRGWDDPEYAQLIAEGLWQKPYTHWLHIDTSKKDDAKFYQIAKQLLDDPRYPLIKPNVI